MLCHQKLICRAGKEQLHVLCNSSRRTALNFWPPPSCFPPQNTPISVQRRRCCPLNRPPSSFSKQKSHIKCRFEKSASVFSAVADNYKTQLNLRPVSGKSISFLKMQKITKRFSKISQILSLKLNKTRSYFWFPIRGKHVVILNSAFGRVSSRITSWRYTSGYLWWLDESGAQTTMCLCSVKNPPPSTPAWLVYFISFRNAAEVIGK